VQAQPITGIGNINPHWPHFCIFAERLCQRALDPDEQIRLEVVRTICEAAAENLSCVPDMVNNYFHFSE